MIWMMILEGVIIGNDVKDAFLFVVLRIMIMEVYCMEWKMRSWMMLR